MSTYFWDCGVTHRKVKDVESLSRFCLSEASNHSFRFEWKFARLSVKDATGKTGVFTHTHTFTHTAWLQILKVACLQTFQLLLLIALLIFSLRFEGSSLKWKCRTRWDLLKVLLISNSSHYGFIKIWVNNGCFLAISRMSDRRALGVQLCERSQKRTCAASKQEMKAYKGRSLFPCLSPWVWIRGGWKCIKPQSRKTKQTKQSKHTHTPACLSFSLFSSVKSSVVVVPLLNHFFDTQSFCPCITSKIHMRENSCCVPQQNNKEAGPFTDMRCSSSISSLFVKFNFEQIFKVPYIWVYAHTHTHTHKV